MGLWVFRILFTAALIYCMMRSGQLREQARFNAVRPLSREEFSWQLTDKLLTDEGKKLASESRLWVLLSVPLLIVCGVLWIGMK